MFSVVISLVMTGCAAFKQSKLVVDPGSVPSGTKITCKGEEIVLLGNPIATGMKLPATDLIDAMSMQEVDLSKKKGKVLFLRIVPGCLSDRLYC